MKRPITLCDKSAEFLCYSECYVLLPLQCALERCVLLQILLCSFWAFLRSCFCNEPVGMYSKVSGLGGLEVACWPFVPKFAGSNPAEAVGFFRAKKSSARLPSEGK